MKKRLSRRVRLGFTLVELLVVMSIIAMLASLLLPAVNAVREAGRRTNCINNQRNVGIAFINYESSKKTLPGWIVPQVPWATNSSPKGASWVYPLLPALDREDIYNEFGASGNLANAIPGVYPPGSTPSSTMTDELHLKILVCPNDTTALGQGANMSYVVNGGMSDQTSASNYGSTTQAALYGTQPTGTTTVKEAVASSVFHNGYYNGNTTYGSSLTASGLSGIADGAANTLMVGENVDAGKWIDNTEGSVTFCWFPFDPTATAATTSNLKINKEIGNEGRAPRASSYHPGGVVSTFCDGHSTFIDENI
ncbi:MAG TPA: DUF1559 domain-containing protein, partial [Pirellulales bacterium]